jgi:hypothetical protein
MGCSETAGTGGSGGDGGQGGVGGGVATDCTGDENGTPCQPEGEFSASCWGEVCLAQDCGSDEFGIPCMYENPSTDDIEPGICSDGGCVLPVEDCTGEDNFTECRSDGMVGYCVRDLCVTFECSGLEDGTLCEIAVLGDGRLGVCEAGQCTIPEDCTGLPDGLSCTSEDGIICEGGECVAIP